MDKCQRCLSKPVSFQCTICTSYRNLCTRCDNIIHNIPSKQNHRRIAKEKAISLQEKKGDNNTVKKNSNNSDINFEYDKDFINNNKEINSIGIEQNDQISNINNITTQNYNNLLSQLRRSLNELNLNNNNIINNNSFLQNDSNQGLALNLGSTFNAIF